MNTGIRKHPLLDRIGNTPLVRIESIDCKLEYFNPSGSVKDRPAYEMLNHGIKTGQLKAGGIVVEASSGSTSISLAFICALLGFEFYAVIPASTSAEKRNSILQYGGKLETVPDKEGLEGLQEYAKNLARCKNAYYTNQFHNEANFRAHEKTAMEILDGIEDHKVDYIAMGVGTGGSLAGIFSYFRNHDEDVIPRAVYLKEGSKINTSIGFSKKGFDCHFKKLRETDAAFRQATSDEFIIDIDEEEAIFWASFLEKAGYPVGFASATNFAAAIKVKQQHPDASIATLFTDAMNRYFSTEAFKEIAKNIH
jgi:cysteine synthase A